MSLVIQTPNLDLVLKTPEEVLAWIESLPPADWAEVSPNWVERMHGTPAGDPWALSYSVVKRTTGVEVGGCAFKGPPDDDGVVEVAYGIDPPHRGRGYATEVTGALVDFAFNSGLVSTVRAHTRPDNPASARVLTKCSFVDIGEVVDPEDGPVRRWEIVRAPPSAAADEAAVPG